MGWNNLLGQKFNRLTVVGVVHRRSPKGTSIKLWECQCDCGNPKHIFANSYDLKRGHTKSCGCYQREKASERKGKPNIYNLSGAYGIGYTTNGDEFYFDLEDYCKIKDYHWFASSNYPHYILASMRLPDKRHKTLFMHDVILGMVNVDHIGGSETVNDNRKSNLRIHGDNKSEFQSRNTWNSRRRVDNTSGTTGVTFHCNRWESRITVDGVRITLGRFNSKDEAIKARKDAEKKYFGKWAKDESTKYYDMLKNSEMIAN